MELNPCLNLDMSARRRGHSNAFHDHNRNDSWPEEWEKQFHPSLKLKMDFFVGERMASQMLWEHLEYFAESGFL